MAHFIKVLENNAIEFSDCIAIRTKTRSMTYHQLNERVNQYAHFLQRNYRFDHGPRRVAIVYFRSLEMVLLMLAVWKINASFILIDATNLKNPGSVKNKLDRIKPQLIATSLNFRSHPEFTACKQFLHLNDDSHLKQIDAMPCKFIFECPTENTEAYIISTSGSSTGMGKLVVVEHTVAENSGILALFDDLSQLLSLSNKDSLLFDCAVNWDPMIAFMGYGLFRGSSLFIVTPEETVDRHALLLSCAEYQVNVMLVVPSSSYEIERELSVLNKIEQLKLIFTGEALTTKIVRHFRGVARGGIYNGYGPCEGPIGITATKVEDEQKISIDRPMKGREYKIVNPNTLDHEVAEGELIWKADGFKEYLDDPDETRRKIIIYSGERYYRSGDLVARKDGILLYLGRLDKQVKVRGIFINPTSVKVFLEKQFPVECHLIVVTTKSSTKTPVLFYKTKESTLTENAMRIALDAEQKVPLLKFMRLEDNENYITSNGKVDETKLSKKYNEFVLKNPTSLVEFLRNLWCEMLNVQDVKDDDNFQSLGGDSVQFAELQSRLASSDYLLSRRFDSQENAAFLHEPTFKNLLALTIRHDPRQMITYWNLEGVDDPIIIIDSNPANYFHNLWKNSPLFYVQPSNPEANHDKQLLDAIKTISSAGLAGPYFIVQTLGADLFRWIKLDDLNTKTNYMYVLMDTWRVCDGKSMQDAVRNAIAAHIRDQVNAYMKQHFKINNIDWGLDKTFHWKGPDALRLDGYLEYQRNGGQESHIMWSPNTTGSTRRPTRRLQNTVGNPVITWAFMNSFRLQACLDYIIEAVSIEGLSPLVLNVQDLQPVKAKLSGLLAKHLLMLKQASMVIIVENILCPKQVNNVKNFLIEFGLEKHNLVLCAQLGHYSESEYTSLIPLARRCWFIVEKMDGAAEIEFKTDFSNLNWKEKTANKFPSLPVSSVPSTKMNCKAPKEYLKIVTFYNAHLPGDPLFIFSPFSGVDVYQEFCEDLQRPCCVLRHPLLADTPNNLQTQFSNLTELAKFYSKVIISLQPQKNISLAGWSFGGTMAAAVANQLYLHRSLAYVGIIDTEKLNNSIEHKSFLMNRILWLFPTYSIPNEHIFKQQLEALVLENGASSNKVWEILQEFVIKNGTKNNLTYLLKIIEICRQHYQFSLERFELPRVVRQNCYVYVAGTMQHVDKSRFGWGSNFPRYIADTDHFTICKSVNLIGHIKSDMNISYDNAMKVSFYQKMQSYILSTLSRIQDNKEHPKISKLVNVMTEELTLRNYLFLTESNDENRTFGLQILRSSWAMYQQNPSQSPLPIYINVKDYDIFKFETFVYQTIKLSLTQPYYLNSIKLVFIIDGLTEVNIPQFMESFDGSPIDLCSHPMISFCEAKYYRNNSYLRNQFSMVLASKHTYLVNTEQLETERPVNSLGR